MFLNYLNQAQTIEFNENRPAIKTIDLNQLILLPKYFKINSMLRQTKIESNKCEQCNKIEAAYSHRRQYVVLSLCGCNIHVQVCGKYLTMRNTYVM